MNPKMIIKRLQNQNILPEDTTIEGKIAQIFCNLHQIDSIIH